MFVWREVYLTRIENVSREKWNEMKKTRLQHQIWHQMWRRFMLQLYQHSLDHKRSKKRKQFSIVLTRIYLTSLIRGPRKWETRRKDKKERKKENVRPKSIYFLLDNRSFLRCCHMCININKTCVEETLSFFPSQFFNSKKYVETLLLC
jgi:hypothetical protein